jgi:hypothetical protein
MIKGNKKRRLEVFRVAVYTSGVCRAEKTMVGMRIMACGASDPAETV